MWVKVKIHVGIYFRFRLCTQTNVVGRVGEKFTSDIKAGLLVEMFMLNFLPFAILSFVLFPPRENNQKSFLAFFDIILFEYFLCEP